MIRITLDKFKSLPSKVYTLNYQQNSYDKNCTYVTLIWIISLFAHGIFKTMSKIPFRLYGLKDFTLRLHWFCVSMTSRNPTMLKPNDEVSPIHGRPENVTGRLKKSTFKTAALPIRNTSSHFILGRCQMTGALEGKAVWREHLKASLTFSTHKKQLANPRKQLSKCHSTVRISNESLMVMNSKSWGNKRSVHTYTHTCMYIHTPTKSASVTRRHSLPSALK